MMASSCVLHGGRRCGWARTVNCPASIEITCQELPQHVSFVGLYEPANIDGKGVASSCSVPQLCATHLHERIAASPSFAEGDIETACHTGFAEMEKLLNTWRNQLSASLAAKKNEDNEQEEASAHFEQGDCNAAASQQDKKQLQKLGPTVLGAATATTVLVRSGTLGDQRAVVANVGNSHGVLLQAGAWGCVTDEHTVDAEADRLGAYLAAQDGEVSGSWTTRALGAGDTHGHVLAQPTLHGADFMDGLTSHILVASSSVWRHYPNDKAGLADLCSKCLYQDQMDLTQAAECLLAAAKLPDHVEGAVCLLALVEGEAESPEAVGMPLDQDGLLQITLAATLSAVVEEIQHVSGKKQETAIADAADALVDMVDRLGLSRRRGAVCMLNAARGREQGEAAHVGRLIHQLYENDFLLEDEILSWQSKCSAQGDEVASCRFMLDFCEWLETAEEENSGSSCEESSEESSSEDKALPPEQRLPVTLLSGFLGSGKTTLLQRILKGKHGLKCAVIVNDMAELNIDADVIAKSGLLQREEKMVEMQNGCICCTLREDLLIEVNKLARAQGFDYLIIESTGISEPQQVAETFTFTFDDSSAVSLSDVARLDTCVTVVDAANFSTNFYSTSKANCDDEQDERTVVDLMVDQLEFANLIVLNKMDLVSDNERDELLVLVRKMNAEARIICTQFSEVDLRDVINTGLFSMDKAKLSPGWLKELRIGEHKPETEEYGIGSFTYRRRQPFHAARLRELMDSMFIVCEDDMDGEEQANRRWTQNGFQSDATKRDAVLQHMQAEYGNLVRSKGTFWLSTSSRSHIWGSWSQAGVLLRCGAGGPWYAEIDREHWGDSEEQRAAMEATMHGVVGDRRQELVFIGQNLNKEKLIEAFDSCLMTAEEEVVTIDDAFMPWPSKASLNGLTPVLFNTATLDGWMDPQSLQHSGLLVKRPSRGKWDEFQSDIDEAMERWGAGHGLCTTVTNEGTEKQLVKQLHERVEALLSEAALPEPISKQLHSDACALGKIVGSLVPSARKLEVKIEIFGESSCSRWHRDSYVGRAIVSYTGKAGTQYIRDDDVDFWELDNHGSNEHIVRDEEKVRAVDIGDLFFIKGTKYTQSVNGIVHKSPENSYCEDGRILNRLILKVDVPELEDWDFTYS